MKQQIILLAITFFLTQYQVSGQFPKSTFTVNKDLKDTFSFTRKWDYRWDVMESGRNKFTDMEGNVIKKKDAQKLYYTANCTTNIQGGYDIRYCDARMYGDTITLTLEDGLPAYASSYEVHIIKDSFYFDPHTVYPMLLKLKYKPVSQSLILNKESYKDQDIIMGYLDITFIEESSQYRLSENESEKEDNKPASFTATLKGWFRTKIRTAD